ncbi:MAG: formyl transferase [Gemmatimonadaceae bacterium]
MRILCCVNRDLESNYALNLLLPELAHSNHATRLVLSERVGAEDPPIGVKALRMIEQTIPNEVLFPLAERFLPPAERSLTFTELRTYCEGVAPVTLNLNTDEGLALINSFAADIVIAIRYGYILRSRAIGAPAHGVINLHSGILPQYRGILSTLYAIAHGEAEVGCTLHWIVDPGIDSGPIIAIARRPVESGRSLLWHILSLYPLGVPLILEVVRRLTSGEPLPRQGQQPGSGTYRSMPSASDVEAMTARGVQLYDERDLRELVSRYAPVQNTQR